MKRGMTYCLALASGLLALSAGAARVYPVPEDAERSDDFRMTVDGAPAPLYRTRVSADPINWRWPGYQRPLYQTELASFALLESEGASRISIKPKRAFTNVVVRPLSANVRPVVDGGEISLTLPKPGAYTVELDGLARALHLFCSPPLKERPDAGDVRTRYFGPGVHDAGLIELKRGETLFIDEGAVVYGRVQAKDADNIRIIGRGVLDASRVKAEQKPISPELAAEQKRKGFAITNVRRYDAMRFEYCDNLLIDGITINDSPLYNIRPIACSNVTIKNVKIIGCWRYNSDGIDMHNCTVVRISDCFLRTYDDSICVKGFDYTMDETNMVHGRRQHDVFKDTVIERCVIWNDWGKCLEIGYETQAKEISGIVFRDCDLIHVSNIGISICNGDQAHVRDIRYEDIRIEYTGSERMPRLQKEEGEVYKNPAPAGWLPSAISVRIAYSPEYSKGKEYRGFIDGISFDDIAITAPVMPGVSVAGYDQAHKTRNVSFRGVTLAGRPVRTAPELNLGTNAFTEAITVNGN